METLWSKRGYFGLLGNAHIFYCPIISYQMKGLKQWLWEYYDGTMVSVENSIPVSTTVIIVQGKIFW